MFIILWLGDNCYSVYRIHRYKSEREKEFKTYWRDSQIDLIL